MKTILFLQKLILNHILFSDAPQPWQFGFQDGASPTQEGITELHDSIFYYLMDPQLQFVDCYSKEKDANFATESIKNHMWNYNSKLQ